MIGAKQEQRLDFISRKTASIGADPCIFKEGGGPTKDNLKLPCNVFIASQLNRIIINWG